MTNTRKALEMAIESMEHAGHLAFSVAIQACKEALEQKDDEIKILKLIANRAKSFPNFPMGYHLQEVFAHLGEKQPIKEKLKQPAQEYLTRAQQVIRANNSAQEPVAFNCKNCHACLKGVADERGLPVTLTRMIVCPNCGNKRCPKASDHRHFCTNSNDTDQVGSIYRTHPAPSQWISVKDRLPEFVDISDFEKSSSDVLILIDEKHLYIGSYIWDSYSQETEFCMRDLDGGYEVVEGMKVTHWMPLPEAPKE